MEQGDVKGVQEAFRQGLASPLDASANNGETAWMVWKRLTMIDFAKTGLNITDVALLRLQFHGLI